MIEIGDYVRTKNQGLKRIDTIFENKTVNKYGYEIGSEWDGKLYSIIKTTDIIKHSKNIIDLIEVGDYVNGQEIIEIRKLSGKVYLVIDYEPEIYYTEDEVKSILTHEQFENIEYKL